VSRRSLFFALLLFWSTHASRDGQPHTSHQFDEGSLTHRLKAIEYKPSLQKGVVTAPNRANGFRLRWAQHALEIEERVGGEPLAVLQTTGLGRMGAWRALGPAEAQTENGRVVRAWQGITEWWVNAPSGVEQGWTLAQRPPGQGRLRLRVHVAAAQVSATSDGLLFRSGSGRLLAYGGLRVFDAAGKTMPSGLTTDGEYFTVEVSDGEAHYPLTIDPLLTAAAWTAESNQADAEFGGSVSSAGDVNSDGFADVIVGAPNFDNGSSNEGRAFLFLGGPNGLAATPAWTAESNQADARFGCAVAGVGDISGDGRPDVLVGAESFDNDQIDEGRAYLYLGTFSGLALNPVSVVESNQSGSGFGRRVSAAGDVNGDGFADVIVGAPYFDNGEVDEGRAYLYLGSSTGLVPTPSWTTESDQANAILGFTAPAGDVNADGYSDLLVAAEFYDNGQADEGRVYLFLGSRTGLVSTPAWSVESNQAGALMGSSISSAGDVNGDGYSDVVVGAQAFDNGEDGEGRAFVCLGGAAGLSTTAVWTAEANQVGASFGDRVATAGDVNGDGYGDVIIGAERFDNGESDEGRASLYLGSASGLASTPAWTAEANQAAAQFASSLANAGDVNGDGFSDVIVGAYLYDNGQADEGRVFVYLGSATGPAITPSWTTESNQEMAWYGSSVAGADVNADGFSDVLVGRRTCLRQRPS
jgi:hypothetical protein